MPTSQVIDIVTHYVPPVAGPAWNRMRGFAEAANERGYRVRFTTPDANPGDLYYTGEPQPQNANWEIHRVPYIDPSRWLRKPVQSSAATSVPESRNPLRVKQKLRDAAIWLRNQLELPDHRRLWNRHAMAALLDRDPAPRLLLTTSPYNSTHLLGLSLKARRDVFWIADFRDPWGQLWHKHQLSGWHRRYNTSLEGRILKHADLLTYFDTGGIDAAARRHGDWVRDKSVAVYQGVPRHEVDRLASAGRLPVPDSGCFRLVYAGSLPRNQWPDFFPEAIQNFQKALGRPVQLDIYGRSEPEVIDAIRTLSNAHVTATYHDIQPREHVLRQLAEADALLIFCGPAREMISSKIFESMAVGRPMIYVGHPESGGARILRESGLEYAPIHSYDAEGLSDHLDRLADAAQRNDYTGFFAKHYPDSYSQEAQTHMLWDVIEKKTGWN